MAGAGLNGSLSTTAAWLLAAGVALLPLQWFPAMPVPGMQVADLLLGLGIAAAAVRWRAVPAVLAVLLAGFAGGVVGSGLANGALGWKAVGNLYLVGLCAATAAIAAAEPGAARRMRQALVAAAVVGAVLGLLGAALFFAGVTTPLLNHFGDLEPGPYPRIRGTALTANMLATLVATGAVLLAAEPALVPRRWWRRTAWAVLGVAAVLTFSRTLLPLSLAVTAAVLARRGAPRWAWLGLGVGLVVVLGLLWVSIRWHVRLDPTRPWALAVTEEPGTRWVLWQLAWETAADNPWLGVGPGVRAAHGWDAHLTWLNLWAVLGLLPVACFAGLVAGAMTRGRWLAGLVLALGVVLVDSLSRDVEDMRHVWVLIGIAWAAKACPIEERRTGLPVI